MPHYPLGERAMTAAERQATLTALPAEYAAWPEALPTNLPDRAPVAALQASCKLDLGELQAVEPPCSFGRY